jgi:hypothetical protein
MGMRGVIIGIYLWVGESVMVYDLNIYLKWEDIGQIGGKTS